VKLWQSYQLGTAANRKTPILSIEVLVIYLVSIFQPDSYKHASLVQILINTIAVGI
jgi:hypothetical protein